MTRDEAMRLLRKEFERPGAKWPDRWITVFEALGVLKLDEPNTVEQEVSAWCTKNPVVSAALDVDFIRGGALTAFGVSCILRWIERGGFKIVRASDDKEDK